MYARKDHVDYYCLIGARGLIYTSENWVNRLIGTKPLHGPVMGKCHSDQ